MFALYERRALWKTLGDKITGVCEEFPARLDRGFHRERNEYPRTSQDIERQNDIRTISLAEFSRIAEFEREWVKTSGVTQVSFVFFSS